MRFSNDKKIFGFHICFLSFYSKSKAPVTVNFQSGLNVICGSSNTGKSIIVDAIDFMLGAKALKPIPEFEGYTDVLLGIRTLDKEEFTIVRKLNSSYINIYIGLLSQFPSTSTTIQQLSPKSRKDLSNFLLKKCGLAKKLIRVNNQNKKNNLSFRYISHLTLINENKITRSTSPILASIPQAYTSDYATFKLLLTGEDDSNLTTYDNSNKQEAFKIKQDLLTTILSDTSLHLSKLTSNPIELNEQLENIEKDISYFTKSLNFTENEYRIKINVRQQLRNELERNEERYNEVISLIERFNILDRHYSSDIERLKAIEEGGTLFDILDLNDCPMCGAEPLYQKTDSYNVADVVQAAQQEVQKIEILRIDLNKTLLALLEEKTEFESKLPALKNNLEKINLKIEESITPKISSLQARYTTLVEKRNNICEAIRLHTFMQNIQSYLDEPDFSPKKIVNSTDEYIPAKTLRNFINIFEDILKIWNFPDVDNIDFDTDSKDFKIGEKFTNRYGKGFRAIIHSAFTLGLLAFCRQYDLPHSGFVILDSPLLAYKEPDGHEDDLQGTDLKEKFYEYLMSLSYDRQVIIIENTDPPNFVRQSGRLLEFSKNPHHGIYGLFPSS